MNRKDWLFVTAQKLLPHHLVSRLAGTLASCRTPHFVKHWVIKSFVRRYGVQMDDAARQDLLAYQSFNDFFTRELRPGARPLDDTPGGVLSPVDGTISQMGSICNGKIIQAKKHDYDLVGLLGGDEERARPFWGGEFSTIYLSPKDYHRVHMPVDGTLREMVYVPGRLFSVNPLTAAEIPHLFARNERVICLFDTAYGPMAVIMVGAMIVASIETIWTGVVTPNRTAGGLIDFQSSSIPRHVYQGSEIGLFKLGSTVITLFGPGQINWSGKCAPSLRVRVGELLASSVASLVHDTGTSDIHPL
jgi:phosphatidylserine decarboxylase